MQAHRNQPAGPRQEAGGRPRKLLFVGRQNSAKREDVLRLFDVGEVQVIGRTASPLAALRRMEADDSIDVVLLGPEFRERASSLFVLNAQACGFAGLILCLMPTARQLALFSPQSRISLGGGSQGARDQDEPQPRSMELSGVVPGNRRGVSTQLRIPPAQTAEFDESYSSAPLTARQRIVLRRVADGWTSKRIAQSLKCSEGAVKATLQHLFRKLGVRKRVLLARIASGRTLTILRDG